MTKSEKRMWLTNIENAGDAVVAEYGSEVNICIGCFACVGLTTAISMIQSIINDHKREKREQEKDKRDLEYHEKRMKDFK